jgi:acetyl esterase/lipase
VSVADFDPSGPWEVRVDDVPYGGPADAPLLARIYAPVGARGPCAALVDVHGGAWTYFDRTIDAYFDHALAACGLVVVALDFRQAPSDRYPTAVADVVAGIRFVHANAARLGARPDAIGVVGGSSGGHLGLLAALRPNAPEYAGTPVIGMDAPVDARVAYVMSLWPIADPLARYRYLLDRIAHPRDAHDAIFDPVRLRQGHEAFFADEATMARASVPRLVTAGEAERLPALWIAHPELDENVTLAMSEALADAYRRAGGHVELEVFRGVGHGFANLPGPAADACIARMKDFVARRLAACQPAAR